MDAAWFFLALALLLLFPVDAFAYIDPGAGSLAYQMALALLLGLGVVLRRFLRTPFAFLTRLFRHGSGKPPDSPASRS